MFLRGILSVALLAVAVGCAKKKDYEKLHKGEPGTHFSKKSINDLCSDASDPCVYLPSVENMPYNVTASRPYWQGEEKLVIAKIGKSSIDFLQIEDDERFEGNINNYSPVLSLPIEHKDYQCKEDEYGDCSNVEEEDTEKAWEKKRYVQINPDQIEIKETNSLPIQLAMLSGAGCFSTVSKEVTKFKVEKDAINFTIKKTYKAAASCANLESFDDLRYLVFTIDYGYSIVKLSSIADPNYKTIDYPKADEAKFGFFKTELKKKSIDNLDSVMGIRKNVMNRWSPNKKEIVYYLNDEFFLPENKNILDSTKIAIETVNASLKRADAGFIVVLKDGRDKSISDIRNNFIIFVKDPQASGVIGYGPSVVNKRTGEILGARTVMYYGTIVKFVSSSYDLLVDEVIAAARAEAAASAAASAASAGGSEGVDDAAMARVSENAERSAEIVPYRIASDFSVRDLLQNERDMVRNIFDDIESEEFDVEKLHSHSTKFDKEIERMAEETFYHASQVNFDEATVQALKQKLKKEKKLVKWDDLSEQERAGYIKELLPFIWVPTLVHEFGHNLGLRHNFAGSTDEANFYSARERQALDIHRDISYSSIMDYAHKQTNELPIMGKYDVAALKFAYAREVETTQGQFVKVDTTLENTLEGNRELALKRYKYCSDEHVGANPLCNRFDEGKNFEEVAKHYGESFKRLYEKRNFRKRRFSFEGRSGDFAYMISSLNQFMGLRNFFEIYDQRKYDGAYDSPDWKDNPVLVDIKKASDYTFNFFMDLLEEPAYHCVEIDPEAGKITKVAPFGEMSKGTKLGDDFGITFDIHNGCLFLNAYGREGRVYLEFGKYFNNSLDLRVDRSQIEDGDTSQIDVRGDWLDKSMATLFLTKRFIRPTTIGAASNGSFLDYPEYRERFLKFTDSLLKNNMQKEVALSNGQADVATLKLSYSFDFTHKINRSYNAGVNALLGLETSRTDFKELFIRQIKSSLKENEKDWDMYSYFKVEEVSIALSEEYIKERYNFDETVKFEEGGVLKNRFGVYKHNTLGMQLVALKKQIDLMEEINPRVLQLIYMSKVSDEVQIPEDAPAELKELAEKLDADAIKLYLGGSVNNKALLSSFLALANNKEVLLHQLVR